MDAGRGRRVREIPQTFDPSDRSGTINVFHSVARRTGLALAMMATVARVSYVKRFKMETDLRDLPAPGPLPDGHAWVPWDLGVLEAHADALYQSFRLEIDAGVFPSFGERVGCSTLMNEM